MKRRVRKKLRLGEFAELGFEASFQLPWDQGDPRLDAFWDRFISAIEHEGLACAGACGQTWDIVVFRGRRRPATESDRTFVLKWLTLEHDVAEIKVGTLFDTWRAG